MKLSVIVATYNAEPFIGNLNEVYNELKEFDHQIIIIDGNSNDKTVTLIKALHIPTLVIQSENDHGIYDAWNKGVKIANGDLLMFLGIDDLPLRGFIRRAMITFTKDKNVNLVYGYIDQTFNGKLRTKFYSGNPIRIKNKFLFNFPHQGAITRSNVVKEIKPPFNLNLELASDFELYIRIFLKYPNNFVQLEEKQAIVTFDGMSTEYKALDKYLRDFEKIENNLNITIHRSFKWSIFKFLGEKQFYTLKKIKWLFLGT